MLKKVMLDYNILIIYAYKIMMETYSVSIYLSNHSRLLLAWSKDSLILSNGINIMTHVTQSGSHIEVFPWQVSTFLTFISLNLVVEIIIFELTIPNLVSVSIFNEIRTFFLSPAPTGPTDRQTGRKNHSSS